MAILFACLANSWAQEGSPHDGNWWRRQTPTTKQSYIWGLCDGARGAQRLRLLQGAPAKDKWDVGPAYEQAFFNKTAEQLADGMDLFYDNFANRSIAASDAFFVVSTVVSGAPPEAIKKVIEALRIVLPPTVSPAPK